MPSSIKFDNIEVLASPNYPQFVKHESAPDRVIESEIANREDGEVVLSMRWGKKIISLKGVTTGTSQANLEANIDTLKELFGRIEKNLDVDWNGSTRRYVATATKVEFDRDHFHLLFCPWTAEFQVTSGEGKATASTKVLDRHSVYVTTPGTDSFTLAGSKPSKPVITLEMDIGAGSQTVCKGIQYENTDNGDKIIFTSSKGTWWSGDKIVIDCLLKKLTENIASSWYASRRFYGNFPRFAVGLNNIKITAGHITNQSTGESVTADTTNGYNLNATTNRAAQSFKVPYTDATFQSIRLMLEKTGTPGNLTARIETDNAGKPSGTLVDTNATFDILSGTVGAKGYVMGSAAAPFTLYGGTTYWLVVEAVSGTVNGSNYYTVYAITAGSGFEYTNGSASVSTDSGSTYAAYSNPCFVFRVMYGGVSVNAFNVKHTVEYIPTYI